MATYKFTIEVETSKTDEELQMIFEDTVTLLDSTLGYIWDNVHTESVQIIPE